MNSTDDFYLKRWSKNEDWTKVGPSKQIRLNILIDLLDQYKINKDSKIIDFGCGSGWILYYLNKLNFKNLYGYDVTPSTLTLVVKKFPFITKIFGLNNETANDIPTMYFDFCVSSEVYEHVEHQEKEKYLLELNSIMKMNSYVYLTTPNGNYKTKYLNAHNQQPVEDWDDPKRVAYLLDKAGFKILEKGSFHIRPKFSFLHKLIFGYKSSKVLELFGLKTHLKKYFEKRMLGLCTYFFCEKIN